jgi:heavy metal translocating P-type ATPase
MPQFPPQRRSLLRRHQNSLIAVLALLGIAVHLVLRFVLPVSSPVTHGPLWVVLALGGTPLVLGLARKALRREFGSDLLAGISIVTSILLHEYLAGSIIVLMLAGGEALESYALKSATSVLHALARRMPAVAHRRTATGREDVELTQVAIGDLLEVHPHEICPVDGVVESGRGTMDESYLTGEPFQIEKLPGSTVISGAVNGHAALTIRATRLAADSRHAKIMQVMRESEQSRPRLRRLGDKLGAVYTPLALAIALLAWVVSGDAHRFLAVLVIATPCPLLLAIPIAIIGSISLCARRAIIVKDPAALEEIAACRTALFDKTGTLTYGEPALVEQATAAGFDAARVLALAASLERYSRHPLARAIVAAQERAAPGAPLPEATQISEPPGMGLTGQVEGHTVQITSRAKLAAQGAAGVDQLAPFGGGLECVVALDGVPAALLRFRDAPRAESRSFIGHLGPRHDFARVKIISGDRESEVRYLAEKVGIGEIDAQRTPEQKLAIVREETARTRTLYVGDGINDAPAMMAATVGIAIGQNSDVTAQAAAVVIMDNQLRKVDEFMHIGARMRRIALQSAVGGMALSGAGMLLAAAGLLSPVQGAIGQEIIDVLAILNALRAAWPPRALTDFKTGEHIPRPSPTRKSS